MSSWVEVFLGKSNPYNFRKFIIVPHHDISTFKSYSHVLLWHHWNLNWKESINFLIDFESVHSYLTSLCYGVASFPLQHPCFQVTPLQVWPSCPVWLLVLVLLQIAMTFASCHHTQTTWCTSEGRPATSLVWKINKLTYQVYITSVLAVYNWGIEEPCTNMVNRLKTAYKPSGLSGHHLTTVSIIWSD